MEIRHNEVASCPLFGGEMVLRDALATYAKLRWPTGTAKFAAREWGLSLDEAKGAVNRRASLTTLDKVLRHPNGGWAIALPILGAVIGHGADVFLHNERKRHAELARRNRALVRDLRSLPDLRPDGGLELDARRPRERRAFNR